MRIFIYILIFLSLFIPMVFKIKLPPARIESAEILFKKIEEFPENQYVILSFDFGPSLIAENLPQAELLFEHLLRRNAKIILFTNYALALPYIKKTEIKVSEILKKENINKQYGVDWINLGLKPSPALFLQGITKTKNLSEYFSVDYQGTSFEKLPGFKDLKEFQQIKLAGNITGLRGIFTNYIEYLVTDQHKPILVHGCTSITIPEAYTFLDSGQLAGFFEGISGAAWYSKIFGDKYLNRSKTDDQSQIINTMLSFAHLVIIFLIILGTIQEFRKRK